MPIFHDTFDQTASNTAAPTNVQDHESGDAGQELERAWDGELYRSEWRPSVSEGVRTSPVLDRGELIERIKRGESPSWTPTKNVSGN